jgi:hypothetical protein
MAGGHVPRNGKCEHGGGPEKGNPKKGRTDKFRKCCKAVDGPFTTHDTLECRRFSKDSSPKDKPTKPFDSAKKTWKKPGSGDPAQIAYLTEEITKLKKRLKKSKKHKKGASDSSDSDSDSDWSSGTGSQVDKRLKLEQPPGIDLVSTDTRPIKATKLALDILKANEIAIENAKTGKVTAVVVILKVFRDKINNSRNANPKKLLKKPNKWLNSKKTALNRPKKHLKRLCRSI